VITNLAIFALAALFEIAGCFAFTSPTSWSGTAPPNLVTGAAS
jgi:drug/metabolite transporter superfamily protein YnfA